MNAYGMHYIRTIPFAKRKAYAQTIGELGSHVAVVVSCSAWFMTDYKCLIVHKDQTLRSLLAYLKEIPGHNTCAFDGVTKRDYSLDLGMLRLDEKDDQTRYVHFVVV
jgi:hypothetical protein